MQKKYILFLLLSLFFAGCAKEYDIDKEYMAFDDVRYVKDFPCKMTLKAKEPIEVASDKSYVKNLMIVDSLMLLSVDGDEGLVRILSLNDMHSYGMLLSKGKAKGEFAYAIQLTSQTSLHHFGDCLFADFYNQVASKIYRYNITAFIKDQKVQFEEFLPSADIPRPGFWGKTFGDSLIMVRNLEDMETEQNRSLINKDGHRTNKSLDVLNSFKIPMNEDFNIMSSLVACYPDSSVVVEAPLGMNYINVYSPLSDKAFTVCVGEKMDKLSQILSESRHERNYEFADVRAYDFGFAVLKYGVTDKIFQLGADYVPSILLFDWEGNALGEIKSEVKFKHFDFDVANKQLYIMDEDGELYRYKCDFAALN